MNNQKHLSLKNSLIISILLHLLLILVFLFGVPSFFEKLPEEQQVITFEMLPTSEISNIKNQNTKKQEAKEAKESQKIKNAKPEPQKVEKKELPKEEPKVEKKEIDLPKEEPKKEEVQPVKKQEEKKKPEPKIEKKPVKKVPKKQEDSIDSILKNLEEASEGETAKSKQKSTSSQQDDGKYSRGATYNENSPLSITEKLLVKQQIEKNWRPPIGAKNLIDVKVLIHMSVEKDGSIKSVTIKNIIYPPGAEATGKLVAESAVRAVWKANPLENLLPERYNTWKEFDLFFDPSNIAQ